MIDLLPFAPYFRNGLLYFPEKTIQELLAVGLDSQIARRAARGLSLDDSASLEKLSCAIDTLLSQIDASSPYFAALASDDAYFMLTGKPLMA
ncbi:MAG: hypothetical protein K8J31_31035 [Anaerolineae bacterium]|nr:hypothetical protein [Anaerolineae bacterium]